ncbi:MAG TPA: SRPBCC domain-containing protein [Bryobacteraceae bacterium]|nr:SRPBCC domain-containing protein [Bryobacteraceae bacterium]
MNVAENLDLPAGQPEVWKLLRDVQRLAGLVPGVQTVAAIESSDAESYAAQVTEKVGPFKVNFNLEIHLTEIVETSLLKGNVKGVDGTKASRATGSVRVSLSPLESGTRMEFEVAMEVLGKLATLGASVIRRRVDELFREFGRRVRAEFEVAQL